MADTKYIVVDEKDKITDYRTQQECEADKTLIRRSVHIVALNQHDHIVLSRRSAQDPLYPEHYDTTANSFVPQGQSCTHIAFELKEETLGITDTTYKTLDKYLIGINKYPEYAYLYYIKTPGPFQYDETTTSSINFTDQVSLATLLANPDFKVVPSAREILKIFLKQYAPQLSVDSVAF